MKRVWYKHFPSDWRSDKKLALVSRAARSFWLDCVGLMQEDSTHRLEIDGRPMTYSELAATFGDNPRTAKKLLQELIDNGVCSVDSEDFVCSRRLLREFQKAEIDKLNGRKGGNPALKYRENDVSGVNPRLKAQKLEPEPELENKDFISSLKKEGYTDDQITDIREGKRLLERQMARKQN